MRLGALGLVLEVDAVEELVGVVVEPVHVVGGLAQLVLGGHVGPERQVERQGGHDEAGRVHAVPGAGHGVGDRVVARSARRRG